MTDPSDAAKNFADHIAQNADPDRVSSSMAEGMMRLLSAPETPTEPKGNDQ